MDIKRPGDVTLRAYCDDDAAELLALFKDTVWRVNSCDYSPEQIAAWASDQIDLDEWKARFAGEFVVVAEFDKAIVGFAELDPSGHLDRFYVSADHQRRGVGRLLLEALIDEANRRGIPTLSTAASITARPFFERHGFSSVATQSVLCRGEKFVNFRMERQLHGVNLVQESTSDQTARAAVSGQLERNP